MPVLDIAPARGKDAGGVASPVADAARPRVAPPKRAGLVAHLRTLFRYRELLFSWTGREISVRYKQAVFGVAWAALQPLSLMAIFSVIFTFFIPVDTNGIPYPIFSFVGLLPWLFFSTSLTTGVVSIINNMALVTKVQFPREILPLAHVGAAGFDCAIGLVILSVFLLVLQWPISWTLLAVPFLVLLQITFTAGLVLLVSAATVRYRDIRFIVPLVLQIWLYVTPIIYPLSVVPAKWQWLIHLNPMATIIEGYRGAVLYSRLPSVQDIASASVISVGILLVGYVYFKRTETWFADII